MGIRQLSKLLKEHCSRSIRERPLSYYSSKKIAIDASMSIYQFLIAVRADGLTLGTGDATTSHLVGLFHRTIRMVELGIVPVYVFDGKAPEMKIKELGRRAERRETADREYREAEEAGDREKMEMYDKRKTKVSSEHVEDCKRLLGLMGIPIEVAPSEAEAHCALLCRTRHVYGVATEDMDALTFGAPVLLRNFNASQSKKLPIAEYSLPQVLEDLELTHGEFVDLCILLGCDYCDTIRGIGPKRALALIERHRSIENAVQSEALETPADWRFGDARRIFQELPEAGMSRDFAISWDAIDREGILRFLVDERGFDASRVGRGVDKLLGLRRKSAQSTLDSFFAQKL